MARSARVVLAVAVAAVSLLLTTVHAVPPTADAGSDQAGLTVLSAVRGDGSRFSDPADAVELIATDSVRPTPVDSAPVANAGLPQTVVLGDIVTLDGSASSDVDGHALSYTWTMTPPQGSTAMLSDPNALQPTFVVDVAGVYVAALVANDGVTSSRASHVVVTTPGFHAAPVSNAGRDQTIVVGQTVYLDGSLSTDFDGQSLTYQWTLTNRPMESGATIANPTTVRPTFVPDIAGRYVACLVVTNALGVASVADAVTLSTAEIRPVADAGPDQLATIGAAVTLAGSASSDLDGDQLAFRWALLDAPNGSTARLSDTNAVNPWFVPDKPGVYQFQLTVNDGTATSAPDTVIVTTDNVRPRADAGPDQTVTLDAAVTVSGYASTDANGDPLSFAWNLVATPAGSRATVVPSGAEARFVTDVPGDYVLSLRVTDGHLWSAPDTVIVTTSNSAPIANAGTNQIVPFGVVTLDGTRSTDADGDPLTYRWSFTAMPPGSAAALSNPTSSTPTFVADVSGVYVIQLIVNDGARQSAPVSVLVTAAVDVPNTPPTAMLRILPASMVVGTAPATLDFSGSSDEDAGDSIASYAVTLKAAPSDSQGGLPDGQQFTIDVPVATTSSALLFSPDVPGIYQFELVVHDSRGAASPAVVADLEARTPTTGRVATVTIDPGSIFMTAIGESATLTAHVLDDAGSPVDALVTWTSSHPDEVNVDAQGRVVALSVGSTLVYAEAAGVRSLPAFIVAAEPKPGALLLTDDQVVAVAPPALSADEVPGIGTRYDVTVKGIAAAPAPGTVVLSTQSAAVAGKIVSTQVSGDSFILTLEYAALYDLLDRYRIDWTVDLQDFPLVPVESPAQGAAAVKDIRTAAVGVPFVDFNCDGDAKFSLAKAEINLTPNVNLKLIVQDTRVDPAQPPTYSKHAVIGSETLTGTVAVRFKPQVKVSGTCTADAIFKIPIGGPVAIIIMPAVRLGLGVKVDGTVSIVEAELSATGKVGSSQTLGWECGGERPECRALDDISAIDEFKFKSVDDSFLGMHIDVSGHFFVHLGLDAVFLALKDVPLIEARIGPKQSLDLATEHDQATNRSYSSKYDLKVAGVVEPASGLKQIIKEFVDDESVSLAFKGSFESDLSKSPRGTFEVSKTRVGLGDSVDFTIRLDPSTLEYAVLGYNIASIEVWRKKDTESSFERFKSIPVTASGQSIFQYHWTPGTEDLGKAQLAAFVETVFPVFPILEIGDDTVKDIEVGCFSSLTTGISGATNDTSACADQWTGTATSVVRDAEEINATVTWTRDPGFQGAAGQVKYLPTGMLTFRYTALENLGCSVTPKQFSLDGTPATLFVNYGPTPPTFFASGSIQTPLTISCSDAEPTTILFVIDWLNGSGTLTDEGRTIEGGFTTPLATSSFKFVRP